MEEEGARRSAVSLTSSDTQLGSLAWDTDGSSPISSFSSGSPIGTGREGSVAADVAARMEAAGLVEGRMSGHGEPSGHGFRKS